MVVIKYLIGINIMSFLMYGYDKYCSIKHYYRVSEFFLLLTSFIGGVTGSLLGMFLFRHKIRKVKFYFFNILYLSIWIILCYYICVNNL